MKQYLEFLKEIIEEGTKREDRTGVGTISVFGHQMRFNLQEGLPAVTTKKLHFKSIIYELLWFLNGDTNVKYLNDNGVTIWDEWVDKDGNLGPIYGKQWVAWETKDGKVINQIANVVEQIRTNPFSRRHIVSAWNVGELDEMALMPCHVLFQFYVSEGKLSCQLYQRSTDMIIGSVYNYVSYSILTHMVAQQCDLEVGDFIWTSGDCHIYLNHLEQVELQVTREPYPLPKLVIKRKPNSIFDYKFEDFEIKDYKSHPHIAAPIAV